MKKNKNIIKQINNLTLNDVVCVTAEDFSSSGTAVAFCDGYPLFIHGAVPGDKLTVCVTKLNKNYGFASIVKIIEKSPYRITPVCPYFEKCGGCSMLNIDYKKQLEIKKNFVVSNISRIGGIKENEYMFEGILGADSVLSYRNKAQFPVGIDDNQNPVCGFYSAKSHNIVPCDDCKIQADEINITVNTIMDFVRKNNISIYNEKNHKGVLRHIYVRYSGDKTKEIMAVIVCASNKPIKNSDKLADMLKTKINLKSLIQNINTQHSNVVLGYKNITLYGTPYIQVQPSNLKFNVSPNSFFQVNYEQMNKLYSKAVEYADITKKDTVFDLYSGVGSIALTIANKAKKVIGVEIVEDAVINAKRNSELNNISNAEFYSGDCTETVQNLLNNGYTADVVIVDPPRKGCDEKLINLISLINAKKLVYVSCNSATLARDIALLKNYGYTLKKLVCVDMFPHSLHIETAALLENNN